jgi:hypothetical protein
MPKKTPDALIARMAALVAAGGSLRASAERAGIPERTARRLAAGEAFKQRVASLRHEVNSRIAGTLGRVALKATRRLDAILDDGEVDAEVKLRAIRGAIADWITASGHVDLAERYAKVEEQLGRVLGADSPDTPA